MSWHTRTVAHPISIISGTHVKSFLRTPLPPRVLPDRFTAAVLPWRKWDAADHQGGSPRGSRITRAWHGFWWRGVHLSCVIHGGLVGYSCFGHIRRKEMSMHLAWKGRNRSRAGVFKGHWGDVWHSLETKLLVFTGRQGAHGISWV